MPVLFIRQFWTVCICSFSILRNSQPESNVCCLPYTWSSNSLISFINVVILFTNMTFRCKMLSEDVVLVDRWEFKSWGKKHFINIDRYFNNYYKKKFKRYRQELTVYLLHILFVLPATELCPMLYSQTDSSFLIA